MKRTGKPNELVPEPPDATSTQVTMRSRRRINWPTTMALLLLHAGALAALFVFTWHGFFAALFLLWVAGGVGISMGYHRLHTHRSYQVPLVLEYFFAICGALGLFSGWRRIGCIIRKRISLGIRIHLGTAPGGLIWAGFCLAMPSRAARR
jgi:hypothetical protein